MKARLHAFSIHILISAAIFVPILLLLRFSWYPSIFFYTEGGIEGLKLLAGIDFFIGPFLTFAIYVPKKKRLRFDLSVIGILQASCLAIGIYIVSYEKPLALIVADGIASTLNTQKLELNRMDQKTLETVQGSIPKLIILNVSPRSDELKALRLQSLNNKKIHLQSSLYVALENHLALLDGQAFTAQEVAQNHKLSIAEVMNSIEGMKLRDENSQLWFLPYFSKTGLIYLVIQSDTKVKIGYINMPPYLSNQNHSK